MFKAELLERAARFRSTEEDPTRNLQSCPSLVLNADYTPLSYYPLSLTSFMSTSYNTLLQVTKSQKLVEERKRGNPHRK